MIDIFTEANRPDLIQTLNTFESSFMWLKKQLESAEKEKACRRLALLLIHSGRALVEILKMKKPPYLSKPYGRARTPE